MIKIKYKKMRGNGNLSGANINHSSPNHHNSNGQQHLTSPTAKNNTLHNPNNAKPLRALHVNVYNQNIGFGNAVSPSSNAATTASFGSSILSHDISSPQSTTPKSPYPFTCNALK